MKASIEIDRQCIAEAVLPPRERLLDFGAVTMLVDEILLPSIQLEDIGNINIPLSLLDAERIKVFSRKQQLVAGASTNTISISPREHSFEIDSSKFLLSTNTEISSLVIKELGLPVTKTMKMEAYLDKLILHEVDGQYTHTADLDKEFGTFGTAILHLPVAGGHEGGNIQMRYKGEQVSCDDCDKLFLSSFYNSCEYIMNPVTRGLKLTLLFNLVWTNSNIAIPADFFIFLTSKRKLESALIPWIANQDDDEYYTLVKQNPLPKGNLEIPIVTLMDEKTFPLIPKAVSSSHLPSVIVLNGSSDSDNFSLNDEEVDTEIEDCEDDEDVSDFDSEADGYQEEKNGCFCDLNNPAMMKCEEEDVLFFVLEEKYFENSLSFHHLQGKDRHLADLLRCCPFIDVHLAMVKHTNTKQEKWYCSSPSKETKSTIISRWIDSNGVFKDIKIGGLNWTEQCVGPIRNLLEPSRILPDKENKFYRLSSTDCSYGQGGVNRIKIRQRMYFRTILVMWPKHRSVEIYCRYGLGMLLNNLESPLTSAPGWQPLVQQQLTHDLRQVVEYCFTYPQRIWTQSAFRNGELTLRLLRLCIALRARKEGLEILKIIGSEFDTAAKERKLETFEGIQNEQVAHAVVKFVCQSNVWGDCVDLIEGLITADRITKQFVPIVKLIQYFLDVKCVKGAMLVGDRLASSIVNLDQYGAAALELSDVSLYMDSIVTLEVYPEASSQERIKSFVSLFPKLNSFLQCRLVLQLDSQGNSRFMGIASCQFAFLEICKSFLSCELRVPSASDAFGLLNCFIRLGNSELLKSLISKIISVPVQKSYLDSSHLMLLQKLISNPAFWKFDTLSELEKTARISVVDCYSTLLFKQLAAIKEEALSPSDYTWTYKCEPLLSSLTFCLRFVMRMERNPELVDPQRIPSISLQLTQMNFEQLWYILDGFQKSHSKRLSKHPCYSAMMREICKLLISEMKKNPKVMQRREAVSNMVWCFIHYLEKSLAQSLIKEVCTIESAGCWSPNFKYQFFKDLVSSSAVWSKLEPISRMDILNSCATLIESWVIEEYQKLDTNTPIPQNQKDFKQSKFYVCVHLFFLIEKHRFDPNQKNINRSFLPYLEKLPLIHLKMVLLDLHISVVTTKPCIKKFSNCLDFFSELCRHFVGQNFLSVSDSEEDHLKILNCLFWIDDARSWKLFADRICSSVVITDGNQAFQRIFLGNANIQDAIVNSSFSFDAFKRIVDYLVSKWKSLEEPSFTWCMPKAKVPNHPEVESFLRSPLKDFYYHIRSETSLKGFTEELIQNGPLNGFSVSVKKWFGADKVCQLEKTKEHHDRVTEPYRRLRLEIENVLKLRQSLSRRRAAAKLTEKRHLESVPSSTTSDEVLILSPPKRIKPDILFLDLTID